MPPLNANSFSYVGDVRPFSLKRSNQFKTAPPPPLKSKQYARDFNEVKTLGAQVGSTRTPDQTALANWIVVNPFGPLNATFRALAVSHGLSTAAAGPAVRDDEPLVGGRPDRLLEQQEPATCSGGRRRPSSSRTPTATRRRPPTPTWMSLFPTPGYPDSPSGYNCFAASMMSAGRAYFGTDRVAFDITNSNATRSYTRFSGYIHDAIEGRIFIGFHFRTADEQGAWLGKKVAQWVAKHEFGRVH